MGMDFFRNTPEPQKDLGLALTDTKLKAEVKRIVYSSDDGSYCVLRLDWNGQEITAVGALASLQPGQEIEATGKWMSHKEHGKQFKVSAYKAILPTSTTGISKYLASGIIPGVGSITAERIVDHFGTNTLDILNNYSKRLSEVKGVSKSKAMMIKTEWDKLEQHREIDIFMQGLGIPIYLCHRIRKQYQANTAHVIKNTPYRLSTDVKGIGFLTADRIALRQGMKKEDPARLVSGLAHALKELSSQGHVCYPETELIPYAAKILDISQDLVQNVIPTAIQTDLITKQNFEGVDYIYIKQLFLAEKELSEKIQFILSVPLPEKKKVKLEIGKQFNEKQRLAILRTFENRINIITGGPGVGKTTVVGEIVKNAKAHGLKVLLAAPTGRAAKRMSESCHIPAKTIHRLLIWDPQEGKFAVNEDKPLKADLLIVDEISMLDVNLAKHLFRAVSLDTRLVLVGDRDQLPSVGPGAVLHDLIATGIVPTINLDEVYRQAANSRIITNAHRVNHQQRPDLSNPSNEEKSDFYWINQSDPDKVNETIVEMITNRIPKRFGYNPLTDIQLLTPMNNGTCGAKNLNQLIQNSINPGGSKPQFTSGDRSFRLGDKVMQKVNNYEKKIFNGDLGFIRQIDTKKKVFSIEFDTGLVEFEFQESDQIMLAYAITIHKSQGSEFPVVILPVLTQHFVMLQKNLLYTAMTRAKKLLILVGTKKALDISISNAKQVRRYSNLTPRIIENNQRELHGISTKK
jgi:exodeoxyribonuclease V alpha subunit